MFYLFLSLDGHGQLIITELSWMSNTYQVYMNLPIISGYICALKVP